MSKTPKLDRKSLREPDEFVRSGRGLLETFVEQRSRFGWVLGLAAVIVAGTYGYDYWNDSQLNKSWQAYYEVQQKPEAEKIAALEDFYSKQGNLRPRHQAAVALADHSFELAKKALIPGATKPEEAKDPKAEAQKAATWYERALEFNGLLPMERQLLLINLAKSYELLSDYDKALSSLGTAADLGGDGRALALLNTGRLQELKGDSAAAKAAYEKVGAEFVDTEYGRLAKSYLRSLGSAHFGPKQS